MNTVTIHIDREFDVELFKHLHDAIRKRDLLNLTIDGMAFRLVPVSIVIYDSVQDAMKMESISAILKWNDKT